MEMNNSRDSGEACKVPSFPIKVGLENAGWSREKRLTNDAKRDTHTVSELSRDAKRDMRYR